MSLCYIRANSARALERLQDLEDALEQWECHKDGEEHSQPESDSAARMLKYVRELGTYIGQQQPIAAG